MLPMQEGDFQDRYLSLLVAIFQKKYLELPDLLFYGVIITSKVIDVHHHRSPLVQGGLDIQIHVTVYSTVNKDAMT